MFVLCLVQCCDANMVAVLDMEPLTWKVILKSRASSELDRKAAGSHLRGTRWNSCHQSCLEEGKGKVESSSKSSHT